MSTPLMIILGLIGLAIIIIVYFAIETYIKNNSVCEKCGRKLADVDSWGYKRSFKTSDRYRCSIHPLKGYTKIFLENKHWKTEISSLSEQQMLSIKRNEDIVVTIKDFKFATITKVFKPVTKTIIIELSIDERKITIKERGMGIYLITNNSTGLKYVGQSIKIDNRWKQHLISNNPDGFHNNLNSSDYTFEVLMNSPKEYLNFFEAYYITKYNTYNNGYNKTKGNFSHLTEEQVKMLLSIDI